MIPFKKFKLFKISLSSSSIFNKNRINPKTNIEVKIAIKRVMNVLYSIIKGLIAINTL